MLSELDKIIIRDLLQYPDRNYLFLVEKYGEKVVRNAASKNINAAFWYAKNIIKGRFYEAEELMIFGDYQCIANYIESFGGINEKVEIFICNDAANACRYAETVLKGRFELGESAIASDDYWSLRYAFYVLKGRFELGEPVIANNGRRAFEYANDVLKGRFELGEPVILHSHNLFEYCTMIKDELLDQQEYIFQNEHIGILFQYVKKFCKKRVPSFEETLTKDNNRSWYAEEIKWYEKRFKVKL
jgi:hypothetical protein